MRWSSMPKPKVGQSRTPKRAVSSAPNRIRRIATRNEGSDTVSVVNVRRIARVRGLRVAAATTPLRIPNAVASVIERRTSTMLFE